jgi:hypothetical protein
MKKYIALLFTALAFTFAGCESDTDPGGTAVEKMAGDWWVTFTTAGNAYEGEYGPYQIYTYNTAADVATEMFVEDGGHFWDFKVKAVVNYTNRTFDSFDFVDNYAYESKVRITEGKVTANGATTPSGMPADKIEFKISFDDDEFDGTVVFQAVGFRRTGFPEDDF